MKQLSGNLRYIYSYPYVMSCKQLFKRQMKPFLRILPVLLAFPLVLSLTGCRDDPSDDPEPTPETGVFELNFRGYWDGAELFLNKTTEPYTDQVTGNKVIIENVKFYVSDLRLVKADGTEEQVNDYHLFDFAENHQFVTGSGKTAHAGGEYMTVEAPLGEYSGVKFGLGVPQDVNNADPSVYGPQHPLSVDQGMHWSWNTGYIFLKVEGKMDTTPDNGVDDYDLGFAYHTGTNPLYREVDYSGSQQSFFEIRKDTETQFIIDVDLARVFNAGNEAQDVRIPEASISHTTGTEELAQRVTDNFREAMFYYVNYTPIQ